MSEADEYLADLRAELALDGEEIIIRRYSGTAKPRTVTEAKPWARLRGAGDAQLVDTAIAQSRYRAVVINDPAATVESGFVALSSLLPLTDKDRLVWGGRELAIVGIDAATRRIAGVTIGIDLEVKG